MHYTSDNQQVSNVLVLHVATYAFNMILGGLKDVSRSNRVFDCFGLCPLSRNIYRTDRFRQFFVECID